MKIRFLLPLILAGCAGLAPFAAAQTLDLREGRTNTEDGQEVDAWVTILDQDESFARDTFEGFIKQAYSLRAERRARNVLVAQKAKIEEISPLRGDLRAVFTSQGSGTTVALAFSPGYDIHLNKTEYPGELARLGMMAKNYVKHHYNAHYKRLLADTDKKIKTRQDDINRNLGRIKRLKEDIAQNEAKISAGDKQTSRLTDRNKKANESIAEMETDITNWEAEVAKFQESASQVQASVNKVSNF